MISRIFYFSGFVQGVGFRYTVKQLADHIQVVGFVRNLKDGRVELQVKGSEEDIGRLLEGIRKKMARNISSIDQKDSVVVEATDFTIKY